VSKSPLAGVELELLKEKTMRAPLIVVVGALLRALPSLAGELGVRIETVPPGATIEQAGRVLGHTPLTLRYPTGYFQTRTVLER
jgi:hypothetical protein